MTTYILGAATLILLVLIVCRRSSPEFRRRSERPKFQFLANLGLGPQPPSDPDQSTFDSQPATTKGPDEEHKP